MFFVVSGFLITSITLRRWGSPSKVNVREFYLLRIARIAPLLLALLVILTALHLAGVHNFVVPARTGGIGRALFAAVTFHVNVLEAHQGYLPGNWDILWSLSVEEMFYLFFPLVCRVFGYSKLFLVILVAFVILGPFGRTTFAHGNEIWSEYSYLGGMDAIAMGCLTALALSRARLPQKTLPFLGGLGTLLTACSLIFSWQTSRGWLGQTGLQMTVLALGTCMCIAAATTQWKAPRILNPLLAIGQRSYEIYLTHMFVVFCLFGLFLDAGKPLRLVPVLFVTVIVASAVLGELIAGFFSEPVNIHLRCLWLPLQISSSTPPPAADVRDSNALTIRDIG
jgi:peptidoglycan/LPS O-acetylase OafA/YrhL